MVWRLRRLGWRAGEAWLEGWQRWAKHKSRLGRGAEWFWLEGLTPWGEKAGRNWICCESLLDWELGELRCRAWESFTERIGEGRCG